MTKAEFEKFLIDSNADENTRIFALNCFESGRKSMREQLSNEIGQMPFGDTAASFSVWIKEQA